MTEACFVRNAVRDYLQLLEVGCGAADENLNRLEFVLDQLAWAFHLAPAVSGTKFDYFDAPRKENDAMRALAIGRFPDFGFYNVPCYVTRMIAESDLLVGDAIDDLADIALETYTVEWCFENRTPSEASQTFSQAYQAHMREHVRGLQSYILAVRHGS